MEFVLLIFMLLFIGFCSVILGIAICAAYGKRESETQK